MKAGLVVHPRLSSAESTPAFGAVFTPAPWTVWLLRRYRVVGAWLGGASVLDPTCGNGQFLVSIIRCAVDRGIPPGELPLCQLFGVEREASLLEELRERLRREFRVAIPRQNLIAADILTDQPRVRAHILVGNPPWGNFSDLPAAYKQRIKPLFVEYGLVSHGKSLLLGHARTDIAALVIAKAIHSHLMEGGEACFFVPLSLFMNEGAHAGFRRFSARGVRFAVTELFDLQGAGVFPGIATRYGAARFRRDSIQLYPIRCTRMESGSWKRFWAAPLRNDDGALSIFRSRKEFQSLQELRLTLPAGAKPRQGVNTCGSSGVMIFSSVREINAHLAAASSGAFGDVILPSRFLYPLLDRGAFEDSKTPAERFVLLPYDESSAKPLDLRSIKQHAELWTYLKAAEDTLRSRHGRLIGAWIKRGYWWACLGVGPYSFMPYKVAWMSYGCSVFRPKIFGTCLGKPWQGNQALHAYVPCRTEKEAAAVFAALARPEVAEYLGSFNMNGTRSWAQPGRITRICEFTGDEQPHP